ncbi:hypothetical protein [Cytobacillus sp. IB215316]|uniref:hypothetical protein n=1 Tax=Cytobacillus sp. IB215316 TaxID=3097354 RepID=UPI002A12D61F|nr:hypothetical protein [Cytobacillus sp. IB215316]MDX8359825.1 hypothetical protein [Cytobacillus sp. IB215316]
MTLVELKQILDATGLPIAYSHFKETQLPPYICYLASYSSNFMADNKVYKNIDNIQIELYTTKKDLVAEAIIEAALNDNQVPWESTETFIESEQLFQKIYEMRLI